MTERLASVETALTSLAKDVREQIPLGNRIEEAFGRALRTNETPDYSL